MAKRYRYKDIDLSFAKHPVTGDIAVKTDVAAIKASMQTLIKMNFYDSPFQPEIGSGVMDLLFNPLNFVTSIGLRRQIELVLENYEPRIEVIEVYTVPLPDEQVYNVTIRFRLKNQPEELRFDMLLEQVR